MKTLSLYLKTKNVPQKTIEARNVLAGGKIFTTDAKVNTAISVASNEGAACDCISFRIKKNFIKGIYGDIMMEGHFSS